MKGAELLMTALLLAGCDQSMDKQNRAETNGTTPAWPSGETARMLPEGVVAQGDAAMRRAVQTPPPATVGLLTRGRERYDIFCSACHGLAGNGDGAVVARGYPRPPTLNSDSMRAASAQHFFDVIGHGSGIMYSYEAQIAPRDRWAIVAYLRALQLSQHASMAQMPSVGEKAP